VISNNAADPNKVVALPVLANVAEAFRVVDEADAVVEGVATTAALVGELLALGVAVALGDGDALEDDDGCAMAAV
jgi:hypothetical protein